MPEQLDGILLRTGVGDQDRGNRNSPAGGTHRFADRVVIGNIVEEPLESTDGSKRLTAKRDR